MYVSPYLFAQLSAFAEGQEDGFTPFGVRRTSSPSLGDEIYCGHALQCITDQDCVVTIEVMNRPIDASSNKVYKHCCEFDLPHTVVQSTEVSKTLNRSHERITEGRHSFAERVHGPLDRERAFLWMEGVIGRLKETGTTARGQKD